ncbi:hypothetical protein Tco_0617773 [Tanacetum coccineum]
MTKRGRRLQRFTDLQLIMCGGMARLQRKSELRGSLFHSGRSMITTSGEALISSGFMMKLYKNMFVLSSSNKGRLLGFIDLMIQKKQRSFSYLVLLIYDVMLPDPYSAMTLFGGVTYSPTAPDTESELLKAPSKTEEPQSLSPTSAPPSPDYTPATLHTDDESEPFETSETRVTSPYFTTSPADPISPPSP